MLKLTSVLPSIKDSISSESVYYIIHKTILHMQAFIYVMHGIKNRSLFVYMDMLYSNKSAIGQKCYHWILPHRKFPTGQK